MAPRTGAPFNPMVFFLAPASRADCAGSTSSGQASGCKFNLEEERVVIDLQAIIGNKWAEISTYLPGRTDNDVKNFWSTRKKKLARMTRAHNNCSRSSRVLRTSTESYSGTTIAVQETRYHIGESSQKASMAMIPIEETKRHTGESSQQTSMRCFSSSSYALHTSTASYSELSSQQMMIPFQEETTHYQIGESSSQQQQSMDNKPFHGGLVPSPDDSSLFAMVPVYCPTVFTDMASSADDGFGVSNYLQEPAVSEVQPIQFFGPEDDGYANVGLLHPTMSSHMVFDEMSPEMLHCFDLPPSLPPPNPPPPPSTQL
uniref:Uncharacterized protein n=1 Tax=Leersia perrieri TaxID=77586 RepID=A0A0D9X9X1_9ORYZ